MPTYTYRCTECEHTFETQQKMSDQPLKECTDCKKETLQKVISTAGGFRITGRGVYKPTSRMA